jgi:hypothetical protein
MECVLLVGPYLGVPQDLRLAETCMAGTCPTEPSLAEAYPVCPALAGPEVVGYEVARPLLMYSDWKNRMRGETDTHFYVSVIDDTRQSVCTDMFSFDCIEMGLVPRGPRSLIVRQLRMLHRLEIWPTTPQC